MNESSNRAYDWCAVRILLLSQLKNPKTVAIT